MTKHASILGKAFMFGSGVHHVQKILMMANQMTLGKKKKN
jgi:hypothetical protein